MAVDVYANEVSVQLKGIGTNAVSLPLAAPAVVGGSAYKLQSIEYCVSTGVIGDSVPGGSVGAVAVHVGFIGTGTPPVEDTTDRTETGCYVVDTSAMPANNSYGVVFLLSGPLDSRVSFSSIQSTWVQAPAAQSGEQAPAAQSGEQAVPVPPWALDPVFED